MSVRNFFLLFLILLCWSCKSQNKKIKGVSFVAASNSINNNHVLPVLKLSSNYVALMPFGFIEGLSFPKIAHNTNNQWFGETEKGLLQYATSFQKQKIGVMVKPHLWIFRGGFTGNISMKTEADWLILEQNYRAFILTYTKVAENIHAEILCIGTELEQFITKRPLFWQKIIKEIRGIYKGKLTYAANWDEYKRVAFWGELDFIGIDAYFPLSDKKTPTVKEYELSWQQHKEEIKKVQKKFSKPILFTEFGYRSVDFAGRKPWDSNIVENKVNLEAQVNGLKAIYNQFWNEDWFAGGFVWKWFHEHDKVGGEKNNRFTPQNKPAEKTLIELYSK